MTISLGDLAPENFPWFEEIDTVEPRKFKLGYFEFFVTTSFGLAVQSFLSVIELSLFRTTCIVCYPESSKLQDSTLICWLFAALFIVDGYYEVYVWEGWMAEDDDDVRTGSGRQRWDRDRKLAMETALNYAKGLGLWLSVKWFDAKHFLFQTYCCKSDYYKIDRKKEDLQRVFKEVLTISRRFTMIHRRFSEDCLQVVQTFPGISEDKKRLPRKIPTYLICTSTHFSSFIAETKVTPSTSWWNIFFLLVSYWFCFDSPEAGKRVSHRVYVVYAGMEPITFKALFPYWNDTPDVIRIQKMVCALHLIGGTVRIVKNNWSSSSCHV